MKTIKNPNEIVDALVQDYRTAFGDSLVSVILYGSAITHEYRPGISDINVAVALSDLSVENLAAGIAVSKKWAQRNVGVPFFFNDALLKTTLAVYPILYLDMKANHRVLYGDDLLSGVEINREDLRRQCERELKDLSVLLRREFVHCEANPTELANVLASSLRRLLPVFKALLVLSDKPIPSTKSDIIAAVEDLHNLGISVLSDIFHPDVKRLKGRYGEVFADYVRTVDRLILGIGTSASTTC